MASPHATVASPVWPAASAAVEAAQDAADSMSLPQFLQAQSADDGFAAWKVLAANWNIQLTGKSADPCPALAREGLQCYRNRRAGLALVKQLNRPVLLTLLSGDAQQPSTVSVVLQGLNEEKAWLEGANGSRLKFQSTSWRRCARRDHHAVRPRYAGNSDISGNAAAVEWLDEALERALGPAAKDALPRALLANPWPRAAPAFASFS